MGTIAPTCEALFNEGDRRTTVWACSSWLTADKAFSSVPSQTLYTASYISENGLELEADRPFKALKILAAASSRFSGPVSSPKVQASR